MEPAPFGGATFRNEPDSDPTLPANRAWAAELIQRVRQPPSVAVTTSTAAIDAAVSGARSAQTSWHERGPTERWRILRAAGDELARRRGDLVAAMIHEGCKTLEQADPEVSEAVDFARFYADRALDLGPDGPYGDRATFAPLGVLAVVPPWNFPVAIPAGGVLASLAAGNGVIFKPAPETPRCAEIVAECCWAAGVPDDLLAFVRTPDDHIGRHLITHPDLGGVILTGAWDTANLFRSWKPQLRIFGETSGKNSLIITPNADLDLAVSDLVASAFGHSGQKCSAASLAICVGGVADSARFRRQLIDAVQSLRVGPAEELSSAVGPTIHQPQGKLLRALTDLEDQEQWLVKPNKIDDALWTPGVRANVQPRTWFHHTECFGPVLGIMAARDLEEATGLQNATPYGLTGGIHSLDPSEVEWWLNHVQVGNAYVNRATTGAIVRRQPFGGWKRSTVGPGAKAGGPNYVTQLGVWSPADTAMTDEEWLATAAQSDASAWREEFSVEHDPTGLESEANIFRYVPLRRIAIRVSTSTPARDMQRVISAAIVCGVAYEVSSSNVESDHDFAARLPRLDLQRVRVLGPISDVVRAAAIAANVHLADEPVTSEGRIELLHYLREQSISITLHRYGNRVTPLHPGPDRNVGAPAADSPGS